MTKTLDDLDAFHLDVIQEIGNIGAGNAATALAQMVSKKIDMDVPKAGILPMDEVLTLIGNEEDLITCVQQSVVGDAPSTILFILEQESAFLLIDMIMSQASGSTTDINQMGESLLKEVGNILSGSFLRAFSDMTSLAFHLAVPSFAYDMLGAVLSTALIESGYYADKVLMVETRFYEASTEIKGHFFILPEIEALEKILSALGLSF